MKRLLAVLVGMSISVSLLVSCGSMTQSDATDNQDGTSEETYVTAPFEADLESFESIIGSLPSDYYYAFADMDEDNDVLLVAAPDYCFDNLEGQKNAISAWVYGFDKDGSIKEYGYVASIGTAYPLCVTDGKLIYANHTTLWKAYIDESAGEMVVEETEDFGVYDDAIEVIFSPCE